jgi:hypothetical protein
MLPPPFDRAAAPVTPHTVYAAYALAWSERWSDEVLYVGFYEAAQMEYI